MLSLIVFCILKEYKYNSFKIKLVATITVDEAGYKNALDHCRPVNSLPFQEISKDSMPALGVIFNHGI